MLSKLRLASRCTYRTCPTHGQEKDNKLGGITELTSVGLQKGVTEKRFKGVIGSLGKVAVASLVEESLFANKIELFLLQFCLCPMQIQRTLAMAHIQTVFVSCAHSRLQFSFSQCDNLRGTTLAILNEHVKCEEMRQRVQNRDVFPFQNSCCNTAVDFTTSWTKFIG